jgi:hypothetical protein
MSTVVKKIGQDMEYKKGITTVILKKRVLTG